MAWNSERIAAVAVERAVTRPPPAQTCTEPVEVSRRAVSTSSTQGFSHTGLFRQPRLRKQRLPRPDFHRLAIDSFRTHQRVLCRSSCFAHSSLCRYVNLLVYPAPGKGRRTGFYPPHGLPIIDFLTAIRAFVEFQFGHGVALTTELASPVPAHRIDSITAARWANGYS